MNKKFISFTTVSIVLINIGIFAYVVFKGLSFTSPDPTDLIFWGGNVAPLTLTGEYWRLFTSIFQHGGIVHLAFNMVMLVQIGILAESIWGRWRFILIYILSGLFGSATSALWYGHKLSQIASFYPFAASVPTYTVSVGASGAIMGIAGACLIHSLRTSLNHDASTTSEAKAVAKQEWQALGRVVGINLVMGFMISGVDNACHLGGAISGMILAIGFLVPLPKNIQKFDFVKSLLVIVFSSTFLISILNSPKSEIVEIIGSELKEEIKKTRKNREKESQKIKYAEKAIEEAKNFLPGVSMEAASGKSLVIEGGGTDIIYNPSQTRAYITNNQANSLTIVDLENFKILKTIPGPKLSDASKSGCPDNRCMGRGAAGVAISKDETWALVSSMQEDHVVFVDLIKDQIQETVKVGRFPRNIVLSMDEAWAFAINGVDNSVSIIDVKKRTLAVTLPLGELEQTAAGFSFGRSIGLAMAPKNELLYLADPVGHQIDVLNMKNPKEIWKKIPLQDFSPTTLYLSTDEKSLWVIGSLDFQTIVKVFNTQDFTESDELTSCNGRPIYNLSLSTDGKWIAIPDPDIRRLNIISLESFKSVRIFPLAAGAITSVLSHDSSKLYTFSQQGWLTALTEYKTSDTLDVNEHVTTNGDSICHR